MGQISNEEITAIAVDAEGNLFGIEKAEPAGLLYSQSTFNKLYAIDKTTGAGKLWVWGSNAYGYLGDGTTENRPSPVRVSFPVQPDPDTGPDHTSTLFWQHDDSSLKAWLMDGASRIASSSLTPASVSPGWQAKAIADINGDGRHEILFQGIRGDLNGRVSYWQMKGADRIGGGRLDPESVDDPRWRLFGSSN